jgi:hypothetical protein
MQLTVCDVDCNDAPGARLEQTVREPSGRRTDVGAVSPGDLDAPDVERVSELLAAAGHVPRRLLDDELDVVRELLARLLVTLHEAGENESLRLRRRVCEATLDEEDIETLLRHDAE